MSSLVKQVCLGPVKCTTCTDFVAKTRTTGTLYFTQLLFAICNNLICCKKGLNVDGKMGNIAFQVVLQQCCKTRYIFLIAACFTVPVTLK